jgi:hypothetical protein
MESMLPKDIWIVSKDDQLLRKNYDQKQTPTIM